MSDLISRQKAIDVMRRRRALFCKNRIEYMALPKDEKARVDEIDNCISDLVNAPDAEPERKWIPVTEALPQNYEQTICIDSRGKIMIGTYGKYGWTFPCYMTEPIAWMPLPEPWRGEE